MTSSKNKFSEQQSQSPNSPQNSGESLEELFGLLTDLAILEQHKNENKEDKVSQTSVEKKKIITEKKPRKISQNIPQKKKPRKISQNIPQKTKKTINLDQDNLYSNPQNVHKDNLQEQINQLEKKIKQLEQNNYEPTEAINILLPLMAELFQSNTVSQETLRKSLTPIIDEVIRARTQQDRVKMSAAISDILPGAIAQEIENSPQEIAKAIAPEMALALQKQIELDREVIPETLGPEMGQAIKNQIQVEQDAMVDALYPVIGNTISKYMVEVVKSINDKVENVFSVEGLLRKMQAKIHGVSEAELILKESINFQVQAVFLIHKTSGLVISQIQSLSSPLQEIDLFAGMLTAIRSFIADCVASEEKVSEVHELEYDDAKIILEVAGYCYLAVIVKGYPPKAFIKKIRQTLSQIILHSGRSIEKFEGDSATIPPSIKPQLENLIEFSYKKKSHPPLTLLILLLLILTPIGIIFYRAQVANHWEHQTLKALDATPELSVYRLIPQVKAGKLILRGRVPNIYLKEQAEKVAQRVNPHLKLDNQVIAVKIPPDPTAIAAEVQRVTQLLNQSEGVNIKTNYQDKSLKVTGLVLNLSEPDRITEAFKQIPGIEKVLSTFQTQPNLDTRIYFDTNSSKFTDENIYPKIKKIQQFLSEHPHAHLKVIGHSDPTGLTPNNQVLAKARAQAIIELLVQNGINPSRLKIAISLQSPPGIMANQPFWLSRCVRFEVFIPSN